MTEQNKTTTTVKILGNEYTIRSEAKETYIQEIAEYVNSKMQEISSSLSTSKPLQIAVLAAVHIADELFRLKNSQENNTGVFDKRTEELILILDKAISS